MKSSTLLFIVFGVVICLLVVATTAQEDEEVMMEDETDNHGERNVADVFDEPNVFENETAFHRLSRGAQGVVSAAKSMVCFLFLSHSLFSDSFF